MINNEKPSLEDLVHRQIGGEYDPIKAHQYYMRTRKLKGRSIKKVDPVQSFSPTLSRILREGQSIINVGQSFVKRFFD